MGYVTLDCRDGNHVACDLCNCECHFKEVEEFSIMGEIEKVNTEFDKLVRGRYTDTINKCYTPRHMRGSKMDTYGAAIRMALIVTASIFAAFAIVAVVAFFH